MENYIGIGTLGGLITYVVTRSLTELDKDKVFKLDDASNQNISDSLDSENYVWSIFKNDALIGCCSLGYADFCGTEIESYPGWNSDCLLLSDVFVLPEYRHQGIASKMITDVINQHPESKNNLVFLTVLFPNLKCLYKKLGFKNIDDYTMVKKCI